MISSIISKAINGIILLNDKNIPLILILIIRYMQGALVTALYYKIGERLIKLNERKNNHHVFAL